MSDDSKMPTPEERQAVLTRREKKAQAAIDENPQLWREKRLRSTWVKLLLASLLLNGLILTSFLFSTPAESPASTMLLGYQTVRYEFFPIEDEAELATIHENATELSMEECIACHGGKKDSDLPLHRLHLTSELLPGLQCNNCHVSMNLDDSNDEYVVRLVDVGFCKDCHSEFPGLEPDSPMNPEDFEIDCTTCHTGKASLKHQEHYLSHVIAPKECKGCHGGRVLPWTPKHEQDDWYETHGPEALEVGEDSCFQCHEFGLQFCDECHEKKPPSHEPAERWKNNTHVEEAQRDTRTCFTCHEADYCKECHVNHEPDWLEVHPATVLAEGADRCEQCHSKSFCAACHADQQ